MSDGYTYKATEAEKQEARKHIAEKEVWVHERMTELMPSDVSDIKVEFQWPPIYGRSLWKSIRERYFRCFVKVDIDVYHYAAICDVRIWDDTGAIVEDDMLERVEDIKELIESTRAVATNE